MADELILETEPEVQEQPSVEQPAPPKRRLSLTTWRAILLAAIVLGAAALRFWLSQGDRIIWGDEPFYLWLGRNWITGQGFTFTGHPDVHHGPLFPMAAGVLYLVTHDMALASDIIYTVFGALLVLPVYALGREIHDHRVGLAAAAITAVFPALTASVLNWGTMTEPLYMFCVYLGIWANAVALRGCWTIRIGKKRGAETSEGDDRSSGGPWWAFGLAGLAYGLAYLTRPEAVVYVAVGGVAFVILGVLSRAWRRFGFWLKLVLYVLAFMLAYMPYAYYVYLNTGAWMVSEKIGVAYLTGIGLAKGDTAAFDKATWGLDSTGLETFFFSSESYTVSMVDLILADLKTFAIVLYLNIQRFAKVLIDWTLFPYLLTPLLALGLFHKGWSRERTLKELFLIATMAPVVSFILFYIQARYIVAVVPVLLIWLSLGLLQVSDWLIATMVELRSPDAGVVRRRGLRFWHMSGRQRSFLEAAPVVVLMAGLLAAYPYVIERVNAVDSLRPAHREVGEALRAMISDDAVIMCRYPAIAFHADARWVPTPNAEWDEVLVYARHKGADYFVIDQRELRYRPQFTDLVMGLEPPPELSLVYEETSGDERMVVYRFVD